MFAIVTGCSSDLHKIYSVSYDHQLVNAVNLRHPSPFRTFTEQ